MPPPTIVNTVTADGTGGSTPVTIPMGNVAAGNFVVVFGSGQANRSYLFNSNQELPGLYTIEAVSNVVFAAVYTGMDGTNFDVVIETRGTGASFVNYAAFEISPAVLHATGDFTQGTNVSIGYSARASGVDVPDNSLILHAGTHNFTAAPLSAATNYTMEFSSSDGLFSAHSRSVATALAGERPSWNLGAPRHAGGVSLFFTEATGGGGTTIKGVARGMNSLPNVTQNSTEGFTVNMVTSADPTAGAPGLTLTAELRKGNGTYVTAAPTITDKGGGAYWVAPIAAHRDTIGMNAWRFSEATAVDWDGQERVQGTTDQDVSKIPRASTALTEGATYKLNKATETATETEQSITQN